MLVALVLGDVEDGYRSIENSFRAVGLSHILAISGFNLAVLGWVVAWMAGLFIRDERWRAAPVAMAALIALWVMAPAASAMRIETRLERRRNPCLRGDRHAAS